MKTIPVVSTPDPHAASHSDGGSDEVDVTNLGGYPGGATTFLRDDGTFAAPSGGTPAAHKTSHENGGADEVSVAGLSGLLADAQTPLSHTHSLATGITDEGALAYLSTVGTAQIDDDAVTYAKMQNVSAGSVLLGRGDSGAGDPQQITVGSGLAMTGTTLSSSGGVTPRRVVGVTIDGGGSTPTVGTVGYVVVPFNGTIDQWHIVADASGSCVVDVWKDAGVIPTNADSIAGSEKPTLSGAQLNSDVALGTWTTTTVTAGDVFGFELESVTTCTRITVEVRISESA